MDEVTGEDDEVRSLLVDVTDNAIEIIHRHLAKVEIAELDNTETMESLGEMGKGHYSRYFFQPDRLDSESVTPAGQQGYGSTKAKAAEESSSRKIGLFLFRNVLWERF
jgi:hypothetical protein